MQMITQSNPLLAASRFASIIPDPLDKAIASPYNKTVQFTLLLRKDEMNSSIQETPRAAAKRTQILTGARQVFLREGYAAASTEVIATESGVSKRTLYAYYPSKEELFTDVLRDLILEHPQTRVLEFLRTVAPRNTAELREALITLAQKFLATTLQPEYLALLRAIIADAHRFPQLTEIVRSTIPQQAFMACSAMLRRTQEKGVIVAGDPEQMTRLFIGPLLTYTLLDGLLRPAGQTQSPLPAQIEELIRLYMRAVAAPEPYTH